MELKPGELILIGIGILALHQMHKTHALLAQSLTQTTAATSTGGGANPPKDLPGHGIVAPLPNPPKLPQTGLALNGIRNIYG